MADQRIEVRKRRVEIILSEGTRLEGDLFLQLFSAHGKGPQRLAELLNSEELFLPLQTEERVQLLNLRQVVSVSCADPEERDELMTLGTRYRVQVTPLAGDMIKADVYVNLPSSRNRVKDFLNQPDRFLPLFNETGITFLNPRHTLLVAD